MSRSKDDKWRWRYRKDRQPITLWEDKDILTRQPCSLYQKGDIVYIGFDNDDHLPLDRTQAAKVAKELLDFANGKEEKKAA